MTKQMQHLLNRVDGVSSPIGPIHIFGPDNAPAASTTASATSHARPARRAERLVRTRAGACRGRVPRALEALVLDEPDDQLVHAALAAAGLL